MQDKDKNMPDDVASRLRNIAKASNIATLAQSSAAIIESLGVPQDSQEAVTLNQTRIRAPQLTEQQKAIDKARAAMTYFRYSLFELLRLLWGCAIPDIVDMPQEVRRSLHKVPLYMDYKVNSEQNIIRSAKKRSQSLACFFYDIKKRFIAILIVRHIPNQYLVQSLADQPLLLSMSELIDRSTLNYIHEDTMKTLPPWIQTVPCQTRLASAMCDVLDWPESANVKILMGRDNMDNYLSFNLRHRIGHIGVLEVDGELCVYAEFHKKTGDYIIDPNDDAPEELKHNMDYVLLTRDVEHMSKWLEIYKYYFHWYRQEDKDALDAVCARIALNEL